MKKKHIAYLIMVVVLVALVFMWYRSASAPGKYDAFAQCLGEQGATFYGAFWCPVCAQQKQLFGKSASLLPYVECSTPDRKGTTPVCQAANIERFPTWDYADESRVVGVQTLQALAFKTGCELPE